MVYERLSRVCSPLWSSAWLGSEWSRRRGVEQLVLRGGERFVLRGGERCVLHGGERWLRRGGERLLLRGRERLLRRGEERWDSTGRSGCVFLSGAVWSSKSGLVDTPKGRGLSPKGSRLVLQIGATGQRAAGLWAPRSPST